MGSQPPSRRVRIVFAVLGVVVALFFIRLSISHHVYAPFDESLRGHVDASQIRDALPERYQHDFTVTHLLRKAYSVVAFAIIGFLNAPLAPTRRRVATCAIVVGAVSGIIEIVQKLTGATEGLASNAIDVLCGIAGGALGALLWDAIAARLTARKA